MKSGLLRDKTQDELIKEVYGLKERLFDLRFQAATGQLDDSSQIKKVKKDIARAKTVLKEKELNTK